MHKFASLWTSNEASQWQNTQHRMSPFKMMIIQYEMRCHLIRYLNKILHLQPCWSPGPRACGSLPAQCLVPTATASDIMTESRKDSSHTRTRAHDTWNIGRSFSQEYGTCWWHLQNMHATGMPSRFLPFSGSCLSYAFHASLHVLNYRDLAFDPENTHSFASLSPFLMLACMQQLITKPDHTCHNLLCGWPGCPAWL